jgi:hypothetical protein
MLDALGIQLSANERACSNSVSDRNQYSFLAITLVIYCALEATSLSHARDIKAKMKFSIV